MDIKYEKFLETFRRIYYNRDYGTDKGQRILEKKAKILNMDYEEGKNLLEERVIKYQQFEDFVCEFIENGILSAEAMVEATEIQLELGLTDDEKEGLINKLCSNNQPEQGNTEILDGTSRGLTGVTENNAVLIDNEINDEKSDKFSLIISGANENFTFGEHSGSDWVYVKYMNLSNDLAQEFIGGYRKLGSLEAMINNIDDIFGEYSFKFAEEIINGLGSDNILEYTSEDIINEAYNNCGSYFEDAKDKVIAFLEEIEDNAEAVEAYRHAQRKARGKFIVFSSDGRVKVGSTNMATGAVQGVFNMIGKGITSISNSISKSNMYNNMEEEFENAYLYICVGMYDYMSLIYRDNGFEMEESSDIIQRQKKSIATIENGLKISNDIDSIINVIRNSLNIYHFTNYRALNLLFDVCISGDEGSLKQNFSNLKVLYQIADSNFRVYPDVYIINKKYTALLTQINKSQISEDEKIKLVSNLDTFMPWNGDNHEDLKKEFVYLNPDNNIIKIEGGVWAPIGEAFKQLALGIYRRMGDKPLGSCFYSCEDSDFGTKINNAISAYGNKMEQNEEPILLYDDTLFGSAKTGFFVTDRKIHIKGSEPIKVDAVESIDYKEIIGVTYLIINKSKQCPLTMIDKNTIDGFKCFISDVFLNHDCANVEVTSSIITSLPEDENCNISNTMQSNINLNEYVSQILGSIDSKFKSQLFYFGQSEKVNTKFKNAVEAYAKLSSDEIPLICYDNTAFGGAKDGFVISDKSMYAHNMWADAWKLELRDISKIDYKGTSLSINNEKMDINLVSKNEREEFKNLIKKIILAINGANM